MSVGRDMEIIYSAPAEHAGEPVVFTRLHTTHHEDGLLSGRLEVVVADVDTDGSELSFYKAEDGTLFHTNHTGESFKNQHGIETAFLETDIHDFRALPTTVAGLSGRQEKPQWLVHKTNDLRRMRDSSRGQQTSTWDNEWSIGREPVIDSIRTMIGRAGITASTVFNTAYYGLAIAGDDEPRLYEPGMVAQTEIELRKLIAIDQQLTVGVEHNLHLEKLIDDVAKSELVSVADAEFAQSRRRQHEIERQIQILTTESTLGQARQILPVGVLRSWPYMDASVADERQAFGQEQDFLRTGKRGTVINRLEEERKELVRRRRWIIPMVSKLSVLNTLERSLQ